MDAKTAMNVFVLNAQSDARISRESFVGEAKDMIDRLQRIVSEIENRGTFSLIDIAVVRDNSLTPVAQRLMQAQHAETKAIGLAADVVASLD